MRQQRCVYLDKTKVFTTLLKTIVSERLGKNCKNQRHLLPRSLFRVTANDCSLKILRWRDNGEARELLKHLCVMCTFCVVLCKGAFFTDGRLRKKSRMFVFVKWHWNVLNRRIHTFRQWCVYKAIFRECFYRLQGWRRKWNLSLKFIVHSRWGEKRIVCAMGRGREEATEGVTEWKVPKGSQLLLNIWTNIRLTMLFVESSESVYIELQMNVEWKLKSLSLEDLSSWVCVQSWDKTHILNRRHWQCETG